MRKILMAVALLQGSAIFFASSQAHAIASFARKEGVSCTTCHSPVPRLNRTGFEYRNAGYRMPDKIGVDQTPKDLSESLSARASTTMNYINTPNAGVSTPGAATTQMTESATGGSIYILTGSWGTNYGSLVEFGINTTTEKGSGKLGTGANAAVTSVSVGPQVTVSDLQLRGAWGHEDSFLSARIGQMPLVEGYGAMDRGLGSSVGLAPVVASTATAGSKWAGKGVGTSAASSPGVEIGYTWHDLDVAIASVNGLEYDQFDGGLHANGNGYPGRDATDPNYNGRDYFGRFNYFIGKRNAVSGYYYHGTVSMPLINGNLTTFDATKYFQDSFTRNGLYGTYFPIADLGLMAGYLQGTDTIADSIIPGGSNIHGSGYFVEGVYSLTEMSSVGGRYTSMNQSGNEDGWTQTQSDLYYTQFFKTGLYYKVDYSYTNQGKGPNSATPAVTSKLLAQVTYMF